MPITVRDLKQGSKPPPRQRNIASLVGGFVIAFGCFALWLLVASQIVGGRPSAAIVAAGAAFAIAVGVWIRLADL
jgi:hypothetical protein